MTQFRFCQDCGYNYMRFDTKGNTVQGTCPMCGSMRAGETPPSSPTLAPGAKFVSGGIRPVTITLNNIVSGMASAASAAAVASSNLRISMSGVAPKKGLVTGRHPDNFSGTNEADMEFGVGVVRGSRSFRLSSKGYLTGVSYRAPWVEGENHAVCAHELPEYDLHTLGFSKVRRAPSHSMGSCGHGFYAYYEGSDDWHEPGMISAVVEGYGQVLIGTRGFRAMKARIVALHVPKGLTIASLDHDYNPYGGGPIHMWEPGEIKAALMKHYPKVPRYRTFDEMLEHHKPDHYGLGEDKKQYDDPYGF